MKDVEQSRLCLSYNDNKSDLHYPRAEKVLRLSLFLANANLLLYSHSDSFSGYYGLVMIERAFVMKASQTQHCETPLMLQEKSEQM